MYHWITPFLVIGTSLLFGMGLYHYGSYAAHKIYYAMQHPHWGKTHFVYSPDGTPATPKPSTPPSPSSSTDGSAFLAKLQEKKGYLVLFSPDDNIYDTLLYLIEHEQQEIQIAIFNFTDVIIAQALAAAIERGITVSIITDRGCLLEKYSKIDDVFKSGAHIYAYNPNWDKKKRTGIMHHKFIIFNKNINNLSLVWTGSYNFTKSARYHNQENVVILNRSGATRKFKNQFERMRTKSDVYRSLLSPVQP